MSVTVHMTNNSCSPDKNILYSIRLILMIETFTYEQ